MLVPFLVLSCVPPPQDLLQVDHGVHAETVADGDREDADAGGAGHGPVLQDRDC